MKLRFSFLLLCISFALHARLPDLIPYRKGNLWGYCDSTKKMIIEPQWTVVSFFDGPAARVKGDKGYGLIDKTGKQILSAVYEWIDEHRLHGLRMVTLDFNDHCGVVDSSGNFILTCNYSWIRWEGSTLVVNNPRGQLGAFDSTGREILPYSYNACVDNAQSMADSGMFGVCRGKKCGVIDTLGNVIVPLEYKWITADGHYWEAHDFKGNLVYYTSRGRKINPGDTMSGSGGIYCGFMPDYRGRRPFKGNNGLYGFYADDFSIVIQPKYVHAGLFDENDLVWVTVRRPGDNTCCVGGYISREGVEFWED